MGAKNEYEARPLLWLIGGAALIVAITWFMLTGACIQFPIFAVAIWIGSMVTRPPATNPKGKK